MQSITLEQAQAEKRKRNEEESDSDIDIDTTDSEAEENESEEEIVNIDFDFFNANPDVDFHSIKNLLRQLFGPIESTRIQLSALADLVLASPTTTIKTDGQESDPYCFLSLIDYNENKSSDYVQYLNKLDVALQSFLKNVGNKKVALVLSERLINMPIDVVSPLYKITLEDASKTLDGSNYDFYFLVSRKYEVNEEADETGNKKSAKKVKTTDVDYYHYEDKFFEKYAKVKVDSEAKKGIISSYLIMDHAGLEKAIAELEEAVIAAYQA